jgi:hypothetical protein
MWRTWLLIALLTPSAALALNLYDKDGTQLNVAILLQPQVRVVGDANPSGGPSTDLYLRRARLLVHGALTSSISFFLETESPNLGLDGDFSSPFVLLDAYASFRVVRALSVDAGLILVPLSHHATQGAVSLSTLDYHSALLRFPRTLGRAGRDVGVQLRGLVLDDHLHYRVGVFNGIEGAAPAADAPVGTPTVNADDVPRVSGQLRVNLLGKESGFFFQGIYFTQTPLLSVGVGADFEPDALRVGSTTSHYLALSADAFLDLPLGEADELVAQVAFHHYDQGEGSANTGNGGFVEVGWRHEFLQPVVSLDLFDAAADTADTVAWKVGANVWLSKHAASVKLEGGVTTTGRGAASKSTPSGAIQAQIYF